MNAEQQLSADERLTLLHLARQAIESAVLGCPVAPIDLELLPRVLAEPGACFVTLTRAGELRGCIGTLEARQALAEDVREHAVEAALEDYRFAPVSPEELPEIEIEISRLTPPKPLDYSGSGDLLAKLKPGVDGVVIRDGPFRATFLPQVWQKIPDAERFLSQLCQKMGANPSLWRQKQLQVLTYQVEEFADSMI